MAQEGDLGAWIQGRHLTYEPAKYGRRALAPARGENRGAYGAGGLVAEPGDDGSHHFVDVRVFRDRRQLLAIVAVSLGKRDEAKDVFLGFQAGDQLHEEWGGQVSPAASTGEDSEKALFFRQAGTLEEVYEPFLMQQGFLARTPRGRVATPAAYRHFGFVPPRYTEQPSIFEA